MFADDAKLYRKIRNPNDIVEMQEDLNRVCDFFDDWQLKINVSKSELLHLGHNNTNHSYTMNSTDIPVKSVCRDFIGIQISDDNKFSRHINELTRVAFLRLKQLRLAFSCKDLDFQVHLYTTFVRPKLEYNTNVWSPHLLQDIDAVEDVQKLFTRTLPGMEGLSYLERLTNLQLKSLEERRIIFDLILVFKIILGLVDLDFETFFAFNTNATRGHNFKLKVQYSRKNYRKYFFSNRVVTIWNELPNEIVLKNSLNAFKKGINTLNLSRYCRGRAFTT